MGIECVRAEDVSEDKRRMVPQPEKINKLAGTLRTAFLQAFLLAAVGAAVATLFNAYREDGLPWRDPVFPAGYDRESGAFETITLDEALRGSEEGSLLFIDARDSSEFLSGHLPGAYNVLPENVQAYLERLKTISLSGRTLVVYCDDPDCDLSSRLASLLSRHGLPGVRILPAGWVGWYEAGFPIEEGKGS